MRIPIENRILAAAIQIFAERGYSGTNLRDVAARAGVTSACLGRKFGTRAGLFEECLRVAAGLVLRPERKNLAEFMPLFESCVRLLAQTLASGKRKWCSVIMNIACGQGRVPALSSQALLHDISRKLPLLLLHALALGFLALECCRKDVVSDQRAAECLAPAALFFQVNR